jgi:ribose transport system substrate-binding protein
MQIRVVLAAALAAALSLVAVAAAATQSGSATPGVAAAKAQYERYKAVPRFHAPGPRVDASKARGMTIFNIPVTSQIPFVVSVGNSMKKISKQLGITFVDYVNQGQPTQWAQGMQQAIARKVDLIVLNTAPEPKLLGPQLAAAK